jgi:hypothetical protein
VVTAVMTLSGFRVAPRIGHLDCLKRVCGLLCKMKHGFLRFHTDEPDYSMMDHMKYDWARTVYGEVKEQIARNTPTIQGKVRHHD